jgi:hypothetical protein
MQFALPSRAGGVSPLAETPPPLPDAALFLARPILVELVAAVIPALEQGAEQAGGDLPRYPLEVHGYV